MEKKRKINWQPLLNFITSTPGHGLTDGQLSEKFEINPGTIAAWRNRNNIPAQKIDIDPLKLNTIFEINPGITQHDVATHFKVRQSRISFCMKKYGIKRTGCLQRFIRAFDRRHKQEGAWMKFVDLKKRRLTFRELGLQFGISKQAANQNWKKYEKLLKSD